MKLGSLEKIFSYPESYVLVSWRQAGWYGCYSFSTLEGCERCWYGYYAFGVELSGGELGA